MPHEPSPLPPRTINLGILAHVDAGKTSLTERLLHAAGVTTELGSVDAGTTRTDSLELERRRGITIKAAVASFVVGGVRINLVDTPGHPDFIAEVERALAVLDGAVLVLSAVEGVQAQTRVLMRTLRRLQLPTLLFVNKIDRTGAQERSLLDSMADRLASGIVPMGTTRHRGTRAAAFVPYDLGALDLTPLAEHDDRVLEAVVEGGTVRAGWIRRALASQTRRALVHPVYFGSAITGAGIAALTDGIVRLLPAERPRDAGPASGTVFKIERGGSGERIALVRMHAGTLRVRDRVGPHTVTGIEVFDRGTTARATTTRGGDIAKVSGLGAVRIGDAIGAPRSSRHAARFPRPTLETVVVPRADQRVALHRALVELAEQDPLIALRPDDAGQELHLSLYGEVQKEVIQSMLADDYGIEVEFRRTTPICIERPRTSGEASEAMPHGRSSSRPFLAGIGLRIEPAPVGTGVTYVSTSQIGALPAGFLHAIEESVTASLAQGLCGWEVTDCVVTLTHSQYAPRQSHAHQGFSKAMSSVGSDFRLLTPLVLLEALRRCGTHVCEPVHRYELEVPVDAVPAVVPLLARLEAPPLEQATRTGGVVALTGLIRAAAVHSLQLQVPPLTRGAGALESAFDSYRPVRGTPPTRPRSDHDPLDREAYLLAVLSVVRT